MKQDLSKICADSLRAYTNEKYNIKLKATHAHELVAAYFGYSSKNALLADTKYPISNLHDAEIVVMTANDSIDQRRKKLQGFPEELPDSYTLGEEVYGSLFSDEWWQSPYPPFRNFEKAAKYLVENNAAYQSVFNLYRDFNQVVDINIAEDGVLLTVYHSYKKSSGEMECGGKTTVNLSRVAGHIGFGKPEISVEAWSGGARRTLESLGVRHA